MMKKLLFGLAVAALMLVAIPVQRAAAITLPGGASDARNVSDSLVIDVRRGGGRGHMGGRHFGGRHFGGRHFGWRGHRVWRGHGPRFYGYYGYPRRCRWVMTYYGPRRVCRRIW